MGRYLKTMKISCSSSKFPPHFVSVDDSYLNFLCKKEYDTGMDASVN